MRFTLLIPGTGHFYCGSCLRDDALGRTLRALGHEVEVVPLYLPLVVEHGATASEEQRVHMGGINMYLQQKSGLLRHLPRWLHDLLDRPGLLRWASRRGKMTEAPDLGAMTLSLLKGEDGRQASEVERLVEWMVGEPRPDVVVLSNAMLAGIAPRLKEALGCPIVATLQGEAPFLDALPAPYSEQAWGVLAERTRAVDAFVPVSHDYGERMRQRLGAAADRFHVVHNGLELDGGFEAEPEPLSARRPPTIGYLARMCRDKGLDQLVAAFVLLKQGGSVPGVRLRVAGVMLNEDRQYVETVKGALRNHGLLDDAEFLPNIDRAQKLEVLRSLSVLSVPAVCGEAFGLYLLEAMACGVPVVQPRVAAFPEILEATGGGFLCDPDSPEALARGLEEVLLDADAAQETARNGRRAVLERFTAERMARQFADVCMLARRDRAPDSPEIPAGT